VAGEGKLEKLRILAFKSPDYEPPSHATFTAYVNPTEIALSSELEWDAKGGAGTTGSRMNFKKRKPGDLSLSFFLDGTGANLLPNGERPDVQKMIREFQDVTEYNGEIHRPNYLKVMWGTLAVKRCVLKSATITYKLFAPSGIPLRAVIAATFTDNSDDKTRVALAADQSADLTHARIVRAGDTLPSLCHEVYGDPRLYLEVAAANGLDDFRQLEPGSELIFPPLER
jgi:Contractile injection system tube protein